MKITRLTALPIFFINDDKLQQLAGLLRKTTSHKIFQENFAWKNYLSNSFPHPIKPQKLGSIFWHRFALPLKVVSTTFLLVCFVCLNKDLWNKEKSFLFHFEIYFHSWDNQLLNFQIFKCHDIIKYLSMKREIHFIE